MDSAIDTFPLKSFQLTMPDNKVCGWETSDPSTVVFLELLQDIAGLTNNSKYHPDYRCRIEASTADICEKHRSDHMWNRIAPCCLSKNIRDIIVRPVYSEGWSLSRQGFLARRLFFLGILPLLFRRRAALVHGALVRRCNEGIAICGPSGMGKSTTTFRLSPDYEALADDCFLLSWYKGHYYAQGVPTWSVLTTGKHGTIRNCNRRVELQKIYLLERGDGVLLPLDRLNALLGLIPNLTDILRWHIDGLAPEIQQRLLRNAFECSLELLKQIPVKRLRLNLDDDPGRLLAETIV